MLEVKYFSFDNNDFSYADIPSSFGSNPEDIKNNYKEVNYISFDGLGIDLTDVNKKFYDGEYAGFISTNCSDENCDGVYLGDLYFSIPEEFPKGITLLFYGQCCKEIWIQYLYNAEELYQYTIEVNDSIVYIPIEPFGISQGEVVRAAGVYISFKKTTLPHQSLKLQSVIIGKVNVLKKFKSSSLLEEINVLSDDLPINSFECSAILKQNINFQKDDPINVYSDGRYYGTFYLDDEERISENTYSIKAYNSINTLENTEFSQWDYPIRLLSDFVNWLSDISGVKICSDMDLSKYSLYGHIPIVTVRYALCASAFACGFMIDSSRDDKVNIIAIPKKVSNVINANRIIGNATFKKSNTITGANWRYPILYNVECKTISTECKNGIRQKILFDKPTAVDYLNSGPIFTHDDSYNFIDFTPTEDNINLVVNEMTFAENEIFIKNPIATNKIKNNIVNYQEFLLKGEYVPQEDGEEYTLIDKSIDIANYIRSGGIVKAKIRLRNEKVGDLIQIETAYDGVKTGIITSMNIHFGYEDTADIEVLEWPNG